ncbi:UDP-N-acetylglucosamine 2-epimerase (non-hydrolyzing) [Akkermansiaceae bacterium]|nr:UDP-N-acetylglucosamine 2-epimerase (non-hydrolyzing) [bacterium]MDB4142978.1 UDP-N-acetylglucosamine 2-epimerase (non-hydrolyzing) [Akkermansiaceae bacterium]
MRKIIDIIAGARPNFMKIAPIIAALDQARETGSLLTYRLIHTGQHYDRNMSGAFFDQLGIPDPDVNFEVGGGTQAEQTAGIMVAYEKLLMEDKSDLCIVVGDVTSTMACTITAKKMGVLVAHVEGGIRSGDLSMPEEINRMATDALSDYFFTTSHTANKNLRQLGVADDRIFFVGNTMIDTLLKQLQRFKAPSCWEEIGLENEKYFVLTLHRPANVDEESSLVGMLNAIIQGARGMNIIFPVHPRTAKKMESLGLNASNLHFVEPLPYLEFNYLVSKAFAVITDSGGITEEATVLGIPCMTLRDNTERPETIDIGTNELVGTNPDNIAPYMNTLFNGEWKKGGVPELWDGQAAIRIVKALTMIARG